MPFEYGLDDNEKVLIHKAESRLETAKTAEDEAAAPAPAAAAEAEGDGESVPALDSNKSCLVILIDSSGNVDISSEVAAPRGAKIEISRGSIMSHGSSHRADGTEMVAVQSYINGGAERTVQTVASMRAARSCAIAAEGGARAGVGGGVTSSLLAA